MRPSLYSLVLQTVALHSRGAFWTLSLPRRCTPDLYPRSHIGQSEAHLTIFDFSSLNHSDHSLNHSDHSLTIYEILHLDLTPAGTSRRMGTQRVWLCTHHMWMHRSRQLVEELVLPHGVKRVCRRCRPLCCCRSTHATRRGIIPNRMACRP